MNTYPTYKHKAVSLILWEIIFFPFALIHLFFSYIRNKTILARCTWPLLVISPCSGRGHHRALSNPTLVVSSVFKAIELFHIVLQTRYKCNTAVFEGSKSVSLRSKISFELALISLKKFWINNFLLCKTFQAKNASHDLI